MPSKESMLDTEGDLNIGKLHIVLAVDSSMSAIPLFVTY
jgi:hypothetical protein